MRRRLAMIAALVAVVGGGVGWRYYGHAESNALAQADSPKPPAIPATVGRSEKKDVPVYLTGLGTVQAFNTVTVKARVDGQIDKVAYKEGQDVKAGDILVQIDPRPFKASLDLAVATKARDQAQLENAKRDLWRFQTAGTIANTQQQIDTQAALVKQLEATIEADQANIDAAQVQLDYTTIRAPLDGRTGIRLVDEGNIVHATDTTGLVVITQLQPISVIFTLPQDQLQEVIHEMNADKSPLIAVAQGRDDKRNLDQGTLALVDNLIDPTTGSVRLKANFPNEHYTLWPGQYVNIRLLLRTLPQVVTVPSTAIQRGPNGMYVYVIKPDSSIAMQPVNVLQMTDGVSVVQNGLAAGTPIVVAGQYRLQPGSRIQSEADAAHLADGR